MRLTRFCIDNEKKKKNNQSTAELGDCMIRHFNDNEKRYQY